MTKDEFKDLFRLVLAGWPAQRTKLSDADIDEMSKLYAAGLGDLDFATARSAIIRVVHTAKFLPTVAEIREAAGVVLYGDQITGLTAWGEVVRAIGKYGAYKRPGTKAEVEQDQADFVVENPITLRVIRTLSWQVLCSGTIETQMSDRARFSDEYDTIAGQERKNLQASPGFKGRQSMQVIDGGVEPRRDFPTSKPLELPSGEERSKMLHDVLDAARHNAPKTFGDLANTVLKNRAPTLIVVEVPCSCTQNHGVNEFGMCLYCRRMRAAIVQDSNLTDEPSCDCAEEYTPLTYDGRCPNCGLYRIVENGANLSVAGED